MTGIGPGGNKIRSLEFLLGQAMAEGCDCVLAAGPEQSNLCTLTAAACARLGLACELVHNSDRPEQARGNLLLNRLLRVRSHFLGPVSGEERNAWMEGLSEQYRQQGRRPFVVRNGASTGLRGTGIRGRRRGVAETVPGDGDFVPDVVCPRRQRRRGRRAGLRATRCWAALSGLWW